MRIECGWGLQRLKDEWQDDSDKRRPEYPLWLFFLRPVDGSVEQYSEEEVEEREEDIVVGMGGLVLDIPKDQLQASWETRTVKLSTSSLDGQSEI